VTDLDSFSVEADRGRSTAARWTIDANERFTLSRRRPGCATLADVVDSDYSLACVQAVDNTKIASRVPDRSRKARRGWDVFGPKRLITRSHGNVLLELDGGPALDLYSRYLGEDEVKALPGSALLFPLQIYDPTRPDHKIVRTILGCRSRK